MHKSFSFKGINRSSDVVLAQDGECSEVINLRLVNGSLRPVPVPLKVAGLECRYSAIYYHVKAMRYLCITDDNRKTLHFFDKEWKPIMSGSDILGFDELRQVTGVEFVGNIVCCLTRYCIMYLLFENGTYRWLGERPEIPGFEVAVSSKVEYVVSDEKYYMAGATDDVESTWGYNEKGYIDNCISLLNTSGHYIDRSLFRVALRLYDGSYANTSGIIYVSDESRGDGVERDGRNMVSEPLTADTSSKYKVSVRGFKPEFKFDTAALVAWKNIVVGIDLFSTASIMGKKSLLDGRVNKFEKYVAKQPDKLWEDISTASLYYKVAEYDIEGRLLSRVEDVSPVNLALQQALGTSSAVSSFAGIDARNSFVYNGRLHIASLREYFFQGYDAWALIPVATATKKVELVSAQTKIRTVNGDFITEKYISSPLLGYNGYCYELPPLLSYPDHRACEMTLFVMIGGEVYSKVFPLTAHKYLNMSCYLHKWYSPYTVTQQSVFASADITVKAPVDVVLRVFGYTVGVHEVVYDASSGSWKYNGENFPPRGYSSIRAFEVPRGAVDGDKMVFTIERKTSDYSFKDIYNIPIDETWELVDDIREIDDQPFEERRNVLKVSMPENPFVFPATTVYTPSEGEILGLAANTTALSQGQFGQYPLYVFCSDGIWAMQVDASGTLAYVACHQLSRDICVNGATICGIGGGVVFAAKQGLMLLVGNSIKKISAAMDGVGHPMTGVPDNIFFDIASLVSLAACASGDLFERYLLNATVTLLPLQNELLICNALYSYSYLCSFQTGFWSKLSASFTGRVYGISDVLMFQPAGSVTNVFSVGKESAGSNRVLLYTRPQIWGTKLPKRVMQLLLHTYAEMPVRPTAGMPLLACYMLCSNDGVHFKMIAGSEKRKKTQDILFPYFPTQSYKYYLFAIVGEMGEVSSIMGMEVDVDASWNNRLR